MTPSGSPDDLVTIYVLYKVVRTYLRHISFKSLIYRNLTVSPCGRSAGTVPEPPELYAKDKIILEG